MAAIESTDRLYVVCLIHLILSIILLADLTPNGTPLVIAGVTVSRTVQWVFATFNAVSIISVIVAGVGNLYLIQSHLEVYLWLLVVSLFVDLCGIVAFLLWGSSCATSHTAATHLTDTVSCSFTTGGVILGLTSLVAFKVVALFTVSRARKAVRSKYSEELLPYLKMSLRSSFTEGSAFGPEAYSAEFFEAAPTEANSRSLAFRSGAVQGSYGSTMMDSGTMPANSVASPATMEQQSVMLPRA